MLIQLVSDLSKLPLDLLLNADPDIEKVKAYCQTEKIFVLTDNQNETIGVYVLEHTKSAQTAEILNVAIAENYQNLGLGKRLIQHAIQESKQLNKQKLVVATGNSSINQIAFYQKCGFEMVAIVQNYFIDHYEKPIFENGIPCKHQLIFELNLKES